MFNIKIPNFNQVFQKFESVAKNVGNFQNFVKDPLANYILYKVRDNFDKEQAPDGTKWLPSIRVQMIGGKTLYQSGKLKNSITVQTSSNSIKIGSQLKYANIHQFGGTIRAKYKPLLKFQLANGKWVAKKQVVIPQRKFLGIHQDASLLNFILDNFEKQHSIDIFTK